MNDNMKSGSSSGELKIVFNAMSLRPGGGLTVLLGLLEGLREQRDAYHLTVICSADDTREAIEAQGNADEVKVVCPNGGFVKRYIWTITNMPKTVRSMNPDIFLSINQFVAGIRCPQVIYHLNLLRFLPIDTCAPLSHRIAEYFRNRTSLKALENASSNVFESHYLRECARDLCARNSERDEVVHVGLPQHWQQEPETGATFHRNRVMAITNPNEHKDNSTLLHMFALLVEKRPEIDWKLVIAGGANSERWSPYVELSKRLHIEKRICWLGFVSQDELAENLRESLCLVSTSLVESFCMVALEAMARGCPAVVSDCTSMPESVGDAAILAEPQNPTAFSDAVLSLHDCEKRRTELVANGNKRIKEFQWCKCAAQFSSLFKRLKLEKKDGNQK